MKKVYLVFGGESCGNHLVNDILVKFGINRGSMSWEIKPISKITEDDFPIVYRRSFPHEIIWTEVDSYLKPLFDKNFITKNDIIVIVPIRNWDIAIKSSVLRNHSTNYNNALNKLRKAYYEIFKQLQDIDYIIFSYDECVNNPYHYIKGFIKMLKINVNNNIVNKIVKNIKNENLKYYNLSKFDKLREIEGIDVI